MNAVVTPTRKTLIALLREAMPNSSVELIRNATSQHDEDLPNQNESGTVQTVTIPYGERLGVITICVTNRAAEHQTVLMRAEFNDVRVDTSRSPALFDVGHAPTLEELTRLVDARFRALLGCLQDAANAHQAHTPTDHSMQMRSRNRWWRGWLRRNRRYGAQKGQAQAA